MKADLHMHTTLSDGHLSCEELFIHAKKRGVDIIAITDHDTCKEVDSNIRLSKEYGITYIPAIELSTLYLGKSVHVLGYFKEDGYQHQEMEDYYVYIREGRKNRAIKFIENLKKYYDITIYYQDLLDISDGIIARPHIAKAIRKHYPEYSHNEVFERFIGEHSIAYVPSTELSLQEGINLLKRHGAITILAHPKLLKSNIHDEVLKHDFDGIEALYGMNHEDETTQYKKIAKAKNWITTAGSDYHGVFDDPKHKDLGDVTLEGEDLKRFLEALNH